jgi:S1-C subfamily serine protease
VTNAHVAVAADVIGVRLGGTGIQRAATTIWLDRHNDIALLRVPALRGVPALPMVRRPKPRTTGAALGFPGGNHDIRAARIGHTTSSARGVMSNVASGFSSELFGRLVVPFRAHVEPGSSGGPVVDGRGRVLATTFAVFRERVGVTDSGVGVPNRFVLSALRRAGPPVDTGSC